ncbi:MAG: ABC transporter permease [Bacteroidales bacterium]|nr:ABC transporter permease [Bacteroidales bacterium]
MKGIKKKIFESLPENNRMERIWLLAKTDFKQRYYESALGMVWALINPMFRLLIYYFVFTVIFESKIPNYALYLFSGLLLWMFFQEATKGSMLILRKKSYLIENIQSNKLDIYVSFILANLFGLLFNFVVYFLLSLVFSISYSWTVLFFPLLLLNLAILVFAVSLLLSTIHIHLKDIDHIWSMVLIVIFWTSPIFYGRAIIFEKLPLLLYVNPMAGIMINVREVLINANQPDYFNFFYDFFYAFVLLAVSLVFFNKNIHKAAEKR